MSKREYNKPAFTFEEQLIQLKTRELFIKGEEKTLHILQNKTIKQVYNFF